MTIRVGVCGAAGRMGAQVCVAVELAGDLELVARIDEDDDKAALVAAGAEVVVDFTNPSAVMDNVRYCIANDINVVIGTSGFTSDKIAELELLLSDRPSVGVLIAPNFGIAAVLMMRFAAQAASYFESAEIIELHHPNKVDAPSGTARRTAELIADARRAAGSNPMPDATTDEVAGARGANIDGVHVHSARVLGMIAHQEVIFGGPGEVLTIRHDSMNRESFMPGVLLGVRQISANPGLTVGLEHFMNLD